MRVSRPRSCAMASESARCADVTTATMTETMAAATIAPTSATSFRRARSQIFDRGRAGAPALNRPPKLLVRWGETTWKCLGIDVLELAKRPLRPCCRGLRLTCGEKWNRGAERRAPKPPPDKRGVAPTGLLREAATLSLILREWVRSRTRRRSGSGRIDVRRAWDREMRGPQRRGPALAQVLEIGLSRLDPVGELRRAGVAPHHQEIERHADAEVRAHGGVDRDQADLERVIEIGLEGDRAIEHRLAVFVLADLQIGRVDGAFDEIAGRIDHEEPRPLAPNLAAEQKRQIEPDVGGLQRDLVGPVHGPDGAPDALRRLEHGRRVEQGFALAGLGILEALVQGAEHRLGEREVAGGGDRKDPLARDREGVQLAEDRDIVEPR